MSRWLNRLLAAGGILVVAGYLTLLIMPVGRVPLLDANREVLAESERAGFCAGLTYMNTRGRGDAAAMKECMGVENGYSTEIDHSKVQPAFCGAVINKGVDLTHAECMTIMEINRFWPTMKGQLTLSWNRRFDYPGAVLTINQPVTGDPSRTGDREGNIRDGGLR